MFSSNASKRWFILLWLCHEILSIRPIHIYDGIYSYHTPLSAICAACINKNESVARYVLNQYICARAVRLYEYWWVKAHAEKYHDTFRKTLRLIDCEAPFHNKMQRRCGDKALGAPSVCETTCPPIFVRVQFPWNTLLKKTPFVIDG